MDAAAATAWITEAARLVSADSERLTRLDAAIGDGDHGYNLARGLQEAVARISGAASPGEVLTAAGRALVSKTGGASGPLYGGALRQAGKALGTAPEIGPPELCAALQAAVDTIARLGRSGEGDKTMIDALAPAVRAFAANTASGLGVAARAAAEAAEKGAAATVPMIARRGRASYLGERSIGHEDPGASSSVLIIRALATTVDS